MALVSPTSSPTTQVQIQRRPQSRIKARERRPSSVLQVHSVSTDRKYLTATRVFLHHTPVFLPGDPLLLAQLSSERHSSRSVFHRAHAIQNQPFERYFVISA